ncbi:PAS domain S-box protein [Flavobacterium sp. LC2016-23]|uniref:PAS domain S-box protein n=1 Tax=Flavobacterium sp. LC2016-23 TaxID=2666330 RepID=UPI0012B01DF9|nr:PAS domain S-box protein [Flavobacterium sp. LC2016-23]MRX41674.1 PAS domain S-box protein [Flavobacterium sp. LC2016-23]
MDMHKLLQRQINKNVPLELQNNPSFQAFIKTVNDSYWSFERDKDLMDHSFQESEKEYNEVNQNLKKEYALKQQSILNLYESLKELDQGYRSINDGEKNDLLLISKYLSEQIAKRKETEKKLFETVQFLKTLLGNLQSGILVVDNNDTILFVNQYLCDIRNIKASPEEMIGKKTSQYITDAQVLFKDSVAYRDRIAEILANNKIVTGEILETIDNRFFERDYIPIFVEKECIGHLWKSTDVTQRIKSKNLLKQSEERNRIIMNSSLNAIVTIDNTGKITFWNNQAETIFGWKKDEVLGKTLNETIIPNRHKKGHEDGLKYYIKTGKGPVLNKQIELPALNNKGHEFPIEISIIPLEQNGEVFFCSFIQDISERKKVETKLKFQEEKYRNIIANMNLGLIEVDNNEIIQYANQSFANISGFEIEELIGLNPSKTFVLGKNIEKMKDKNKLREQGVSDVYQMPVRNKRGELRWWAIGGAPNYDDKGNLVGSIGIHLDITEQKQMEEELESEKIKAQEASKAKEIFLANMSHEIRTPLNGIIGFLRELERQQLTDLQKKYVENSTVASKHLLSIINNILDISKIEAGEMSLEEEDFIFKDVINNVVTVLEPLAKKKGLKLIAHISKDINTVLKGDFLRLEQVLFNLVGNSLKFTTKGKIYLKCEIVQDSKAFQKLQISVEDTGIGMEQNFADIIFNKFSQEDKAITRKFGGTGLGMTITRELIQLMNGEINVQSEKGSGTTVSFILNFEKGDIHNIKKVKEEINFDISGIHVLLVEDNIINRMVAINSLHYFNCVVTEATNGLEAIEILKNKHFDIILMDVQMPEMDGIEATIKIKKELKLQTPIIALTANAFKSEVEKCKNAGMDDYITKPFEEFDLVETIARYTNKKFNDIDKSVQDQNQKRYDLKVLHSISRGNAEFVSKMIIIFIEQIKEILPNAEAALASDNFSVLNQLVHKIKPSIESMGIISIKEEIALLEKSTREIPDKEKITRLFFKIKETLLIVAEQLQEEI